MPVRERMEPQTWWNDMQFSDGKWQSVSAVMSNMMPRNGQSVQFVQALTPPAHMPTAQPVCEAGEWYWIAEEGAHDVEAV